MMSQNYYHIYFRALFFLSQVPWQKSDLGKLYFIYFEIVFNAEPLSVSIWLESMLNRVCFLSPITMPQVIKG